MTDDRSLERAARSWIEVGPTRAPSHAVDAALLRIETTPQERDLRIPRRFTVMPFSARVAAAALIGVLLVGGAVYMFSPGGRSGVGGPAPSPAVVATASPSASIPAGAQIDKRVQVGQPVAPRWFAADATSLWVHEPAGLVRVDLATAAVSGQVPLDSIEYGYVTTGAGAVWQSDWGRNTVVRIDPSTSKVVASIPVGAAPSGIAFTAGAVWVADQHDGAITRIDPKTNRVVATIQIGPIGDSGPQIMTAGPNGSVWVDVENMGSVVRVDAATNKTGLLLPLDGPVASDGAEVWIGVYAGPNGKPEVVRVDPVSGKVITAVDLDSGISYLAVGLGSVWVLTDGGLVRIDEATGRIVGRLDLGGDGGNVVVAGGSVWVTADNQPYVLRISPQ